MVFMDNQLLGIVTLLRSALKDEALTLPEDFDWSSAVNILYEHHLVAMAVRGVQSPGLWADYVAHLAQDGQMEAYCFRDKRSRNDGHTVAYTVNGSEQPALNAPAKESILSKLLFRDFSKKDGTGLCDIPLILKKYGG